jgi:hypothetical protein
MHWPGRVARNHGGAACRQQASPDRVQTTINNCLADISANLLIHGAKNDERGNGLLMKQEDREYTSDGKCIVDDNNIDADGAVQGRPAVRANNDSIKSHR